MAEEEISLLLPRSKTIGIDLGLANAFVTSEGKKENPSSFLKKELKKLRRRQKALSRKTKGSANRTKAKKVVASLFAKIKDKRMDYLHKKTTELVNENQVICTEDLNVKKMMQNKKLSRSIGDAGWRIFLNLLKYKCDWYKRKFVSIDRFFPSSNKRNSR